MWEQARWQTILRIETVKDFLTMTVFHHYNPTRGKPDLISLPYLQSVKQCNKTSVLVNKE